MENLKLRIWDKELEYMAVVRLIDFETNTIYANDKSTGICHSYSDFVYDDGVSHPISNIIMMRPSGLYDKNGKEIWEGDVHEFRRSYFVIKFGYYTDDDTHSEMYGWYFDSNTLEEQASLGVDAEKYVNIVGNVCENPEFYGMRQLFLTRYENNRRCVIDWRAI